MTVLVGIIATVAVIGSLVIIHELGHFTTARLFHIQVDEFGIGFPPRLFAFRRGETEYTINAIPLGGFVRMLGENGDSLLPRSFGAKPAWQRCIVLSAGALMNLLAGLVLFFVLFAVIGLPVPLAHINAVSPDSPAAAVLQPGDSVTAVDGHPVRLYTELKTQVDAHLGQNVTLVVRRGTRLLTVHLVPRAHPPQGQGALGVVLGGAYANQPVAVGDAARMAVQAPVAMVQGMWGLLTSPAVRSQSGGVSGPVGIARATSEAANQVPRTGWGPLIELAGLLSLNFAIVNLLPLPALDGGRLMIAIFGAVRRRAVAPEVEGTIHAVGMALLLLLMVVITYQDIARWLTSS
jgi:regulator of sigma E protease